MNRWSAALLLLAAATVPALPPPLLARADERDATRLEVGDRYCFHRASCLKIVQEDVSAGRPIQWVIYSVLQATYAESPENAERAYEAATRAMTFANDFLSDSEWHAGQTTYAGANMVTLRAIFIRYVVACENKIQWLPKYHCIRRALYPLLPGQYHPVLVPLEPLSTVTPRTAR